MGAQLQIINGGNMKPSLNRNSRSYFWKLAGCCTRCEGPFSGDTAFIVDEKIAWAVFGAPDEEKGVFTQMERVPVCSDCVEVAEEARVAQRGDHATQMCGGCNLAMKIATRHWWRGRFCSERCEQRVRRRRQRERSNRRTCTALGCGIIFRGRADAKYCSSTCRQASYRHAKAPIQCREVVSA